MRKRFIVYRSRPSGRKLCLSRSVKLCLSFIVFFFLCFLYTIYYIPLTAYAADSSPSADIQSKLKALQSEIASKASQIQQEVNKKLQNRAYVGIVRGKTTNTFTVETLSGNKTVSVNEYTDYQGKNFSFKSLGKDDYLAALGDIDENGVMLAKRVVKLKLSETSQRSIVWGTVTGQTDTVITIRTPQAETITINSSQQAIYKLGKVDASAKDIRLTKSIIVVGSKKDNTLLARFIYILPYSANLKIKTATPSASLLPTAKTATQSSLKR